MADTDMESRVDAQMQRMGFELTDTGPYAMELREWITNSFNSGVISMSGGTWAPGFEKLSSEERAKGCLAFMWAAKFSSYRVERIDGKPWGWRIDFDIKNPAGLQRYYHVNWPKIPGYIRDSLRKYIHLLRKAWREKVVRITNPYV